MKASFILSAVVASMLPKGSHDKIVQACEAERNRRVVVKASEKGMKHIRADAKARSTSEVVYEQVHNDVTAFMIYAEAEVGTVDKTHAKLRKLVGGHVALGGTLEFPATFQGHDIAAWVAKLTAKPAKAPANAPEASGKGIPAPAVNA